jgi:hypothetical protein
MPLQQGLHRTGLLDPRLLSGVTPKIASAAWRSGVARKQLVELEYADDLKDLAEPVKQCPSRAGHFQRAQRHAAGRAAVTAAQHAMTAITSAGQRGSGAIEPSAQDHRHATGVANTSAIALRIAAGVRRIARPACRRRQRQANSASDRAAGEQQPQRPALQQASQGR